MATAIRMGSRARELRRAGRDPLPDRLLSLMSRSGTEDDGRVVAGAPPARTNLSSVQYRSGPAFYSVDSWAGRRCNYRCQNEAVPETRNGGVELHPNVFGPRGSHWTLVCRTETGDQGVIILGYG